MTIEKSKEKLQKDGYTWFELSDFNADFYEWLKPFKCNQEINIKDKFTYLRADINYQDGGNYIKYKEDLITSEGAFEKKSEFSRIIKESNTETASNRLLGGGPSESEKLIASQMWYFTDFSAVVREDEEIHRFENYIKNIITYFFDFSESQEYSLFAPSFTYYDMGCKLENHSDGTGTGRICALLIYLNESYDENDGGILILNNNEKVIPTFGRVALIDLQSFDIKHMVTEVTGGLGRYALLSFIKKKENEFVDY